MFTRTYSHNNFILISLKHLSLFNLFNARSMIQAVQASIAGGYRFLLDFLSYLKREDMIIMCYAMPRKLEGSVARLAATPVDRTKKSFLSIHLHFPLSSFWTNPCLITNVHHITILIMWPTVQSNPTKHNNTHDESKLNVSNHHDGDGSGCFFLSLEISTCVSSSTSCTVSRYIK